MTMTTVRISTPGRHAATALHLPSDPQQDDEEGTKRSSGPDSNQIHTGTNDGNIVNNDRNKKTNSDIEVPQFKTSTTTTTTSSSNTTAKYSRYGTTTTTGRGRRRRLHFHLDKKLWWRRRSINHRTRTSSSGGGGGGGGGEVTSVRILPTTAAVVAVTSSSSFRRWFGRGFAPTAAKTITIMVVGVVIMSMLVGGVVDAFTVGTHSSSSSSTVATTPRRLRLTSHTQPPLSSPSLQSQLHRKSSMMTTKKTHRGSKLNMAIIYGWDEYDDPADAEKKDKDEVKKTDGSGGSSSNSGSSSGVTTTPYVTTDNYNYAPFAPTQECPTVGASVAETLSGNTDRTGSLARLAVRFARIQNNEHSNLPIEEIEHVRVLCVHPNSIELEATLCETHGCVSLHVPISFPTACSTTGGDGSDGAEAHFEACILQHLESLDDEDGTDAAAVTTVSSTMSDIIQQWMDSTELSNVPEWWVDASKISPELVKESKTLQNIMNEDEFTDELKALARDALKGTTIESGVPYDSLIVEKSKCLSISHTGIALKIVGRRTDLDDSKTNRMILDVYYPFESGKKSSADSSKMSNPDATPDVLRKAVLGAVAIAS